MEPKLLLLLILLFTVFFSKYNAIATHTVKFLASTIKTTWTFLDTMLNNCKEKKKEAELHD